MRQLEASASLNGPGSGTEQFWTSGELAALQVALRSLWSETAVAQELPPEYVGADHSHL